MQNLKEVFLLQQQLFHIPIKTTGVQYRNMLREMARIDMGKLVS